MLSLEFLKPINELAHASDLLRLPRRLIRLPNVRADAQFQDPFQNP